MLKTTVATPNSKNDPSDVIYEEIPLPPLEKWPEHQQPAPASAAPVSPVTTGRPVAALTFRKQTSVAIQLDYDFDHPELGHVEAITVRRLTVSEVADLVEISARQPDLFYVYAAMTGVPADVLRGLEAVDGDRVTGACYDFLPPLFRRAVLSSTSQTGEQ